MLLNDINIISKVIKRESIITSDKIDLLRTVNHSWKHLVEEAFLGKLENNSFFPHEIISVIC